MARKKDLSKPSFSKPNPRMDSAAWKRRVGRARKKLESDSSLAVCWLCESPIDMDLPYEHREAFTLDHLIPVGRGGDIDGPAKPAHRHCNSRRKDGRRRTAPRTVLKW